MPREEFSRRTRAEAFLRCGGKCERCPTKLREGNHRYNHRIPCEMGGKATIENCEVLCIECDAEQTYKKDIPAIAKVKRVAAKHNGTYRPSRNPMPFGRGHRLKRKINGSVVKRNDYRSSP